MNGSKCQTAWSAKVRLLEFYQELGGEITEELGKITGYIEHCRRIDELFADD